MVYQFQLVNKPTTNMGAIDKNVRQVERQLEIDGVKTETTITTRKANGSVQKLGEIILFTSTFRTSNYNTFIEKMEAMNISSGWRVPDTRGQSIHILGNNISATEFFDKSEMEGINNLPALVHIQANLTNNNYYNNYVFPVVYDDYASLTVPAARLERRDELGVPPIQAVYIQQSPNVSPSLTGAAFTTGASSAVNSASFIYELPYYMKKDYRDLQTKTAEYCTYRKGQFNSRRLKILESSFPVVTKGNYQVDITYTVPGINIISSRKTYFIKNPVK